MLGKRWLSYVKLEESSGTMTSIKFSVKVIEKSVAENLLNIWMLEVITHIAP